jgi:hypothetical protein
MLSINQWVTVAGLKKEEFELAPNQMTNKNWNNWKRYRTRPRRTTAEREERPGAMPYVRLGAICPIDS